MAATPGHADDRAMRREANGSIETGELLKKARALIENERDWWPGSERTKPGQKYVACAANAICGVTSNWEWGTELFARAIGHPEGSSSLTAIWTFNDTHEHSEVLAAFDRAIELAELNRATQSDAHGALPSDEKVAQP